MEHIENTSRVFTASLLDHYYHLWELREYHLLKENFYYNFESFVAAYNFKSRIEAVFFFRDLLITTFGLETADVFIEILDIEKNFDINLLSPSKEPEKLEA